MYPPLIPLYLENEPLFCPGFEGNYSTRVRLICFLKHHSCDGICDWLFGLGLISIMVDILPYGIGLFHSMLPKMPYLICNYVTKFDVMY
jgi:hypothetical protein